MRFFFLTQNSCVLEVIIKGATFKCQEYVELELKEMVFNVPHMKLLQFN